MPPSFQANCAYCHSMNICFPSALIAKAANRDLETYLGAAIKDLGLPEETSLEASLISQEKVE